MPLSGCGDFPSPLRRGGARAWARTRSRCVSLSPGTRFSFCKLGLAALVPEGSRSRNSNTLQPTLASQLALSDLAPSLGQVTTLERPGKPRGSSRLA